ncbi:MAG: LamG domain-containing protein, partial [Alistipes sp.]
ETFLVPVRIASSSMSVLNGSSMAYYVVKRSLAITTAAQLTDNWIDFASLDKVSNNSMVFNFLKAVTYEALIYVDDFMLKNAQNNPVNISSVMGVEQYLLLRIGDTNFERQQLQLDGSGVGFGKFPGKDATKILEAGRWYHVATTFDQASRTVCLYVDGKLQSQAFEMGPISMTDDNRINLAMRALYNLWEISDENSKPMWAAKGYDKLNTAYQFFIGRSFNDERPLNGKVAEVRVWSVARTPEQIWDNMYNIDNPKNDATLLGYWKFNEGQGNEIKDFSRYGNNGLAHKDLIWPAGIEIPQINK